MTRTRFSSEEPPMRPLYSGLPAAASFEQSILFAQLELLRWLDSSRIQTVRAALLGK